MRRNQQLQQRSAAAAAASSGGTGMSMSSSDYGGYASNNGGQSHYTNMPANSGRVPSQFYNPNVAMNPPEANQSPMPPQGYGSQQYGMAGGDSQQGGGMAPPPGMAAAALNNMFTNADPMVTNMAMAYGTAIAGQSKEMAQKTINKWFSVDNLKYYFAVDNSYVGKKLGLVLFPFAHKNWSVQCSVGNAGDGSSSDTPVQPRFDVNAPDLYIPAMAIVTYILCGAYALGMHQRFTPEVLGVQASTALAWLIFEVFVIMFAIYLADIKSALRTLDLVAFCSYKFVGMNVCLVCGVFVGTVGYYAALAWCGSCMAYMLLRCLKPYVMTSTQQNYQEYSSKRMYLLFVVACLQPFLMHWLTKHLLYVPPAATATLDAA